MDNEYLELTLPKVGSFIRADEIERQQTFESFEDQARFIRSGHGLIISGADGHSYINECHIPVLLARYKKAEPEGPAP